MPLQHWPGLLPLRDRTSRGDGATGRCRSAVPARTSNWPASLVARRPIPWVAAVAAASARPTCAGQPRRASSARRSRPARSTRAPASLASCSCGTVDRCVSLVEMSIDGARAEGAMRCSIRPSRAVRSSVPTSTSRAAWKTACGSRRGSATPDHAPAPAACRIRVSVVRLVITSASSLRWISAGRPAPSAALSAGSKASVVPTRSPANQP